MGRKGREEEDPPIQEDDVTVVRPVSRGASERVRMHDRAPHRAVVHISSNGAAPRRIYLAERDHIIGRSGDVDISLVDESISRQHAVLLFRDEDYVLKDLDSKNGTFLNGTAVHECPLHSGDVIQIGNHSLRFLYEANHASSTS